GVLLEQLDLGLRMPLLPEITEIEASGAAADYGDTHDTSLLTAAAAINPPCKPSRQEDLYTRIIRLPRFSPANSPISALGVFSRPSMTSSWTFNLPEATHDCSSFNA